ARGLRFRLGIEERHRHHALWAGSMSYTDVEPSRTPGRRLDELDAGHRRVVAVAGAELEDPGVAAGPIVVARRDLVEQLVGHVLVADEGHDLPVLVDAALLGFGDELLGHRPERLGLGLGRHQRLGRDERGDEVAEHRLLMLGVAAQAATLAGRARHGSYSSLTRSDSPRSSSFWMTSSSDFWPKLVIASRSSSVFSTSSPMRLICARLRQLRGRSERSSSSIGRSRSGEPLVTAPTSPSSRPWGASLMSAT